MSTEVATRSQGGDMTAPEFFAREVQNMARRQMEKLVGGVEGQKAAQSITMAFLSAMSSARDPKVFADIATSRADSIANCIALSAQTKLYPGGPNPDVYLVPQSGELQWRITHRGVAKTLARAGLHVMPVAVGIHDEIEVSMGEVISHKQDPATAVESLDGLLGVAIVIRRMGDSQVLARPWVPIATIQKRRAKSRMSNAGPWKDWPVEMAIKTAILYLAARGAIPAESQTLDVVTQVDNEDQEIGAVIGPADVKAIGGAE
jgi:recombinational DNA repair protein RecT